MVARRMASGVGSGTDGTGRDGTETETYDLYTIGIASEAG